MLLLLLLLYGKLSVMLCIFVFFVHGVVIDIN